VAGTRAQWPTVAVLLAGGSGVRAGLDYPKQFLRLGGLTVMEHTLLVFESEPSVDEVVIVGAEEWIETTWDLVRAAGSRKVRAVIPGGATRNESTRAAIEHLVHERQLQDCKLLLHDAVRPLVDRAILRRCWKALNTFDAVDVVIETADTIVEVADGLVTDIPPRSRLRRGQTPQGFSLRTLASAYQAFSDDALQRFTDDCAVVLAALPGVEVAALDGSEENIKITRPVDIYLADRLLQSRQTPLPPISNAPLDLPGPVVVFGGTSGIGEAIVGAVENARGTAVALGRSVGVDVRRESEVCAALDAVRAEHGPIAAVVNSAGVLTRGPLVGLDVGDLRTEVEVNLLGSMHVARASHRHLTETSGHLLMFTSSSYTRGRAEYAAYSASKAGVVNLTQALAEEWLRDGVKVNCINPARTSTPMRTRAFGVEPQGTLLTPERVADVSLGVLRGSTTGHIFDIRLGA
jgi:2-C-methyl-D-erythritol 4-phosphate cytidylyltransferase